MKVLVCGGRDFHNTEMMCKLMDEFHAKTPIARLVHGGARGADMLAEAWAFDRGVPSVIYFARWSTEGLSAGPRRNQRMLDEEHPDMVLAFPGGKGTRDMIKRAEVAHVPYRSATPQGWSDVVVPTKHKEMFDVREQGCLFGR